MTGVITKGIGGFYYVKATDGNIYECHARGALRRTGLVPAIGDEVELELVKQGAAITKIAPRRSYIVRPSVANIDMLMFVVAAASPEPNLFTLDKMTVNAEIAGIEVVICINKTDLASSAHIREIYECAGYKTFEVSAEKNEGIDAVRNLLKGRNTAFAGLSGVGKSTLLNLLTGGNMETRAVSEKLSRGKHTTRHIERLELPFGGAAFDTPGFSSLDVTGIKPEELGEYFPEIRRNIDCRFRGCAHINEPDCGVRRALSEGKIAPERYESYTRLYEILRAAKNW